jgi:O-succinylbenzoic acid--CoA ligase
MVDQRVALVVQTSGSTGAPKRVALSADALLASAAASDALLGGPGQWLLAVPAHYIAGINVLVRSLASQTEPAIMPPGSFTAERFVETAAELGAPLRFTSLVPAQLARLMAEDAALETLRRFDRILIGGQAAPVELLARALELGLNVTRTYGSSETSGGCVWDGVPIGNTEVRIVDGRVELAGSVLAEGYLDDPDRTDHAFHVEGGQRWYRTDDTGTLVDGVLSVTGRVDDVIVSGGEKVSLAEVERVVRALPGLEGAVVVAADHAEWGQVPVVVSTAGIPLDGVRDAVAGALGRAAAPARIVVIESIPLLDSGKPDRLSITALAAQ